MPPIARERKNAPSTVKHQRSILTFGKISKPQAAPPILGKRKTVDEGNDIERDVRSKRRIAESIDDVQSQDQHVIKSKVSPKPSRPSNDDIRLCKPSQADPSQPSLPLQAPKSTLGKKELGASVTETPTKGARSILESFSLQSSPPSTRNSSPVQSRLSSPPTSPASTRSSSPILDNSEDLPEALQDLIRLHSSFLSALSLHYAHHGVFSPVDLGVLKISIERIWGKRKVGNDDIQKILGLTHQPKSQRQTPQGAYSLSLVDYGHERICVELADNPRGQAIHKRPIDEESCHARLCERLEQRWTGYVAKNPVSNSVQEFLDSLPLLPIKPCASLSRLTPLLAKGQRRLEDLKDSAIQAQKSPSFAGQAPPARGASSTGPRHAGPRRESLLSRIRAKELVQSTLPRPPTAAAMSKKLALQRIEEIAPVLELLTSGSSGGSHKPDYGVVKQQQIQTKSFTMPTIVQNLQMSLRNPISKEDAVRSVSLLSEVCPEWIGLNVLGKCVSVTVRKYEAVGKEEIKRRVRDALLSLS